MARTLTRIAVLVALLLACAGSAQAASVTLAWDPNPEPNVRYIVYWGTQHLVYASSASAGTATSYQVIGLTPGQTYYFAVQATTIDGLRSPFSEEVSVTMPSNTPTSRKVAGDFSGTGRTSLTVFRRSTGQWFIRGDVHSGIAFGASEDIPVPGDYDGDGRADIAVWRPSNGVWYLLLSADNYSVMREVQWGTASLGDVPVPGDYDGDGKTDIAVWRGSTGEWWILESSGQSRTSYFSVQWGSARSGDIPVPGDYDGDGRTDIAVWRAGTGQWFILNSSDAFSRATATVQQWGAASQGDVPVPADYDGDGMADIAVWRPGTGTWFVLQSSTGYARNQAQAIQWGYGGYGDAPVPGDYDGDGKADLAVWRPSTGSWFILSSGTKYSLTSAMQVDWGSSLQQDTPVTGNDPLAPTALRLTSAH